MLSIKAPGAGPESGETFCRSPVGVPQKKLRHRISKGKARVLALALALAQPANRTMSLEEKLAKLKEPNLQNQQHVRIPES